MKKLKKIFPAFVLITVLMLSGCSVKNAGNTLYGFTQRMNEKSGSYSLTDSGYIYNKTDSTLTKYYVIGETSLMLQFSIDDKNELYSMNIVFDNLTEDNTAELGFIENCIECYCEDSQTSSTLLNGADFPQVLFTKRLDTIKSKVGNTEMLIDVTDIGCVITVFRNTL